MHGFLKKRWSSFSRRIRRRSAAAGGTWSPAQAWLSTCQPENHLIAVDSNGAVAVAVVGEIGWSVRDKSCVVRPSAVFVAGDCSYHTPPWIIYHHYGGPVNVFLTAKWRLGDYDRRMKRVTIRNSRMVMYILLKFCFVLVHAWSYLENGIRRAQFNRTVICDCDLSNSIFNNDF